MVAYISMNVKLCLSQPLPQIQPYGAKVRTGHPGLSLSCSPGGPLGLPKGRRLLTIPVWKELVTKTTKPGHSGTQQGWPDSYTLNIENSGLKEHTS